MIVDNIIIIGIDEENIAIYREMEQLELCKHL